LAWRFHFELTAARGEVAQGQFAAAKKRLYVLAHRWPRQSAVEYGLGLCEQAEGRLDAAMEAWGRVPPGTAEAPVAALERGRIAVQLGRYVAAEESLRQAWNAGDAETRDKAYTQLGWLLQIEGRHRDVRRLIEQAGDTSAWALRTFWLLDTEPVPVELVRSVLKKASHDSPQDDRVWLAQANLALRMGELDLAGESLGRCEQTRTDDPVVILSRLDWAVAAERPELVCSTLGMLSPSDLAPAEIHWLDAWLARHRGDRARERAALDALLELEPACTEALERRADLEFEEGRPDQMESFRQRKDEVDRIKERYRRLVADGDPAEHCGEAARLAQALGRPYEARGWARWRIRQAPTDTEAQAILDSLTRSTAPARPAALSITEFVHLSGRSFSSGNSAAKYATGANPQFIDCAGQSGLRFTFDNGRSPSRQLPETMSGGLALLDYDGDGWLDVYVVQGGRFPPEPGFKGDRLFRNRGDGTFEDATARAGIDRLNQGYGHGVTVGDYDNDGDPDLFITRWRSYSLYRNDGGRFVDVTTTSGLSGDRDWPTSAAFADLDGDGDLDLYVCHYLGWDADSPKPCRRKDTGEPTYCTPVEQPALPDHVFRNDGGRFVDVSTQAGITEADTDGRGLGVLAAQLDDDMKIDLYVANDMTANYLFRNLGGFRFGNVAQASGTSGSADGGYQAGMGIARGDLDGDGRLDLAVTNFYGEGTTLYHCLGAGVFTDRSRESGLWVPSRYRLGFGTAFLDADNDGWLDLVTANGHVNDLHKLYPFAMPAQFFRNLGGGRLRDASSEAGNAWSVPHVGRGLAAGDLDNDGRTDVLILVQNEPLVVLCNQTQRAGHWVTFQLEGTKSNRDGVGSIVRIKAGGRMQVLERFGGGSYQSASDPRLHAGLGNAGRVEEVEVCWPSGRIERWRDLRRDTGYLLREGESATHLLAGFGRGKP
jgi:tetratricopeptide (TPR) repeat protein